MQDYMIFVVQLYILMFGIYYKLLLLLIYNTIYSTTHEYEHLTLYILHFACGGMSRQLAFKVLYFTVRQNLPPPTGS